MEIIIGNYSGFCNGVKYTVDRTTKLLKDNGIMYSIGDIVHNEVVINDLKKNGLVVEESIVNIPNNSKVIIRAHGEGISTYDMAKEKNMELFDLTCGKVKVIHQKILSKKDDYFVIIIGKKTHPETIAHATYSDNSFVIENNGDVELSYEIFKKSNLNKVYIVAQTTFNEEKFYTLCDEVKKIFKNTSIIIDNTICNATHLRQEETKQIASCVDKMIIVGGINSSNTKELAIIAKKYCKNVYLVQTWEDLKDCLFRNNDIVGIVGGASTPSKVTLKIKNYLNNIYNNSNK